MLVVTSNPKMANAVTHGGTFHADDVFSTVILEILLDVIIVLRTFELPTNLPKSVIVFDIGKGRYDHHQKGGNGKRANGVPYAACGLLWRDFGKSILKKVCDAKHINFVWQYLDDNLISGIDAVDNGKMPGANYPIQTLTISKEIAIFNPKWDSNDNPDQAFVNAVNYARICFNNMLNDAISKSKAQPIIDREIENSTNSILILEKYVAWMDALFNSTNPKAKDILFVVCPSNRGGYNWHSVPTMINGTHPRKTVPDEWKGLQGKELQHVTGVETANFCHSKGFIGSAETFSDAIKLAELAVKN